MTAGGARRAGEVVVVGAGVAGLVAALRLAEAGRPVRVLAKGVGSTHVTGGSVDVLGYAPAPVISPAASLPAFVAAHPDHPYGRVGTGTVDAALRWLKHRLGGLRYVGDLGHNLFLPTALGVPKPTALVPLTMAAGDVAGGASVVVVGLPALKDFYPALVAGNLSLAGTASGRPLVARAVEVDDLPVTGADVGPLAYARRFDDPAFRAALAHALAPRLGPDEVVALPAVLGMADPEGAWEELEARLERPVFEIATLPPSVPGIRLFRALAGAVRAAGGRVVLGAEVVGAERDGRRVRSVVARAANGSRSYPVDGVVLATGGWASGGIEMDSSWAVRETVLGLPVAGVPAAGPRFLPRYLDEQPLTRAGVEVDSSLRPVDRHGAALLANVRVAGATVAGADASGEKSGGGVSVATGYAAAGSILAEEGPGAGAGAVERPPARAPGGAVGT